MFRVELHDVKTDDGSKIYSSWSDKKNIKTKKVKTEKKKS